MLKNNYECAPDELYVVCRLGWQLCLDNINSFAEFNPKYNEAYIKQCEAIVEDAAKLPETTCRNQRIRLIERAEIALANWERLKRYIINTFPSKQLKARLKSSGEKYYEKAMAYDWDSLQRLLKAGCKFIKDHGENLRANRNMPDFFYAKFVATRDEIKILCKEFAKSEAQEAIDAERKIKANNAIYSALMDMFSDAQKVFANNQTLKQQFVFDDLLSFAKRNNFNKVKSTPVNPYYVKPVSASIINQKYTPPVYVGR